MQGSCSRAYRELLFIERHDLSLDVSRKESHVNSLECSRWHTLWKEPGIENYDVSSLVSSHGEYSVAVREILHLVGYNQPTNARV